MSQRSEVLRVGVRATVGLLVTGIAATAIVLLGNVPLPGVERTPLAMTVDTSQDSERTYVCAGSFAELGADPTRSGVAVPLGTAAVTIAGDPTETTELVRQEEGGSAPAVVQGPADAPLVAAQTQRLSTPTLSGLSASACTEPVNEQWLVGGSTAVGASSTLSLGNPGQVPATARVTVYDAEGPVDAGQTTGVLVPPGSERTVSLNGYAADREQLAVRVVSTGATVTATMGVSQIETLDPFAVDTVTRQLEPQSTLVIPGVTNIYDHVDNHGDQEGDYYPVQVRLLAPDASGRATVRAVDKKGESTELGSVELEAGAVAELRPERWPEGANAVIVEADVPVVGGVLGTAVRDEDRDYAWFAPGGEIPAETPTAAAVVSGGGLVLVNPGAEDAEAEIAEAGSDDEPRTVKIPAGAAVTSRAPASAEITSTAPIFVGVRMARNGIAGYPVLPAESRSGELTVYTR
ncbi:hypothetical protein JD276_01420 [Leucobacter sp. CSA1]|uniref:Large extracellular alpha-helical protein n=1 Tax=Leucobacter chromiisoli TaxID=2796471 RepID=A0A934Q6Y9_9MICO|nr:DUF5719 family protein [Leucobacter chromiisoli]MBK0417697.1 hypothetical protein [Leucobacter chromiisoli]